MDLIGGSGLGTIQKNLVRSGSGGDLKSRIRVQIWFELSYLDQQIRTHDLYAMCIVYCEAVIFSSVLFSFKKVELK